MYKNIKYLWSHVEMGRKKQLIVLLLLIVLASLAEVLSLGALLPFLAFLSSPDTIMSNAYIVFLVDALGISSSSRLLVSLTGVFMASAIAAGVFRLSLIWYQSKLSHSIGSDLSINIFRKTLYQPYEVHFQRNSSEVISGIVNKVSSIVYQIILPLITFMSAIVILTAVLSTLFIIDPQVALFSILGFSVIYCLVAFSTKKKISRDGLIVSAKQDELVKSLQEGLGGIRDILLHGSQETHCETYSNADRPLRNAQADIFIMSACPRYIVEAMAMVLIAFLALIVSGRPEGLVNSIPVLGALALGSQRLLPLLQQIYYSWSTIKGAQKQLEEALILLDQPLPVEIHHKQQNQMSFEKKICFKEVSFKYPSAASKVVDRANFEINRGDRIGIIGKTGSGKSTLADILMGLLMPTSGRILVDGISLTTENMRYWQSIIAHVPQNIYLKDASIAHNITFGSSNDKIDMKHLEQVVKKAQLTETINSLENKYETLVGERGARLSGGQTQRIAVARALYRDAQVLVFDEPTSALDNQTATEIMDTIKNLDSDITVVLIAHRRSLLKSCSKIIEISNTKIINH